MIWPLESWSNRFGLSAATRRSAMLGGGLRANTTTLGELRKFVAALEGWPDRATVAQPRGAVLHVEYTENADPRVRHPEPDVSGKDGAHE